MHNKYAGYTYEDDNEIGSNGVLLLKGVEAIRSDPWPGLAKIQVSSTHPRLM